MKSIVSHAVAIAAVFAVGIVVSCTAAQRKTVDRVLTISAAECVRVATAQGRTDVATYCGVAESLLPVLEAAMQGAACEVPQDAGAE
jgi:hypothetical protein